MIGRLAGTLAGLGDDGALIDVNGVGYVVACGPRTLADLPGIGRPVTLLIETQVREDAIRLFGFLTETERDWFRLLQSVQGVGAKVALAILSTLAVPELTRAVALGDKAAVARAPGVGPKLAARIVAELKDKVPAAVEALQHPTLKSAVQKPKGAPAEALSALVNLGYGQSEAAEALAAVLPAGGEGADVAVLIRLALKELAR